MKLGQTTVLRISRVGTITALTLVAVVLVGQRVATAQTISWIDVGIQNQSCGGAANIALNPVTSRLYLSGWKDDGAAVAVIDVSSDVVTPDRERIVNHEVVSLPGFRFFNCFDTMQDQGQYLAVDPAVNRVYMLGHTLSNGQYGELALAVMDGETNAVTYVNPFGGEELFPYTGWHVGIAVNPTSNRIYFAGSPRGSGPVVVVVDGATLEVVRRYTQPTWIDPDSPGVTCTFHPNGSVGVDPNRNRVYFTGTSGGNSCNSLLGVIDEATGEFTVIPKYIRTSNPREYFVSSSSRQMTVDPSSNRVFIRATSSSLGALDEVIAIDGATGQLDIISTGSVEHGDLGGLVVNPVTQRLYVQRWMHSLFAVDLVTGTERLAVDLPFGWNFAVAYNPEPAIDTSRNRMYILSDQGWLTVVDLGTSEVSSGANVAVQADSASISFDEVTTAGSITVTPIGDPSTAGQIPGGFAISDLAAYEITPSPSFGFTGTATTCFRMPGIDDSQAFASLRVLHMEQGVLVDRTSSHEFSTRTLCATTTSFSPFYVARVGSRVNVLFDQARAYRAKSTIPIRLQMMDGDGVNLSSPSLPLTIRGLASLGTAAVLPIADAGNANPDSGFRFDPALAGYVFNLKTTGLAAGRYALSFWAGVDRSFFYTVVFDVR